MPIREIPTIASVDLMVANVMLPHQKNGKIEKYVEETLGHPAGTLQEIDRATFEKLSGMLEGHPHTFYRGGGTSITLETMGRVTPSCKPTLVSAMGSGLYSNIVTNSFENSNVELHRIGHNTIAPETAVTFVLQYPNGKPTMLTYPGNAKEIVTPESLPWDKLAKSDFLFLQGSMRQRFSPEVMDALLTFREKTGKKLVLAYPDTGFTGPQEENYYNWITTTADVIVTNARNMMKKFPNGSKEGSLESLQMRIREDNEALKRMGHHDGQTAFVTDGTNGCYVVNAQEIKHVPAMGNGRKKPGILGAGYTAYAGFLVGHLSKLPPEQCGQLAMALAGEKLQVERPSLENPREVLERSHTGSALLRNVGATYLPNYGTQAPEGASDYFIG